jgi:hypothetical protein
MSGSRNKRQKKCVVILRLLEKIKTPFTPIHKRAIPLIVKGKTQRSAIWRNSPDMSCQASKR